MYTPNHPISRRAFLDGILLAGSAAALAACGAAPKAQPAPEPTANTVSPSTPAPVDNGDVAEVRQYLPGDDFIRRGPDTHPRIALTFDDFTEENSARYLEQLNKIAEDSSVLFTLFPTGAALAEHKRLGAREPWHHADNIGHLIGNHSFSHPHLTKLSDEQIRDELRRTDRALDNLLDYTYNSRLLVRPPYGDGGLETDPPAQVSRLLEVFRSMDRVETMWTTDSNDKNGETFTPPMSYQDKRFLKKIFTDPNEKIGNGSIILVHPGTMSINGVKELVSRSIDEGYELTTVTGLFEPK